MGVLLSFLFATQMEKFNVQVILSKKVVNIDSRILKQWQKH
ncbi:hypothetical protein BH20ACI4_BH20ACI4_13240 [soil metagenome]